MTKPLDMLPIYKTLYEHEKETNRLQFELIKELMDEIRHYRKNCGSHWPSDHKWCGCPECGECECVRCKEFDQTQYKMSDPFCKVCNSFLDESDQCKECRLSKALD